MSAEVRIRPARPDDVEFMVALARHEDVAPYMSASASAEPEAFLEELERTRAAPHEAGRYVIEADGERAGVVAFDVANRRSRIAHLYGIMLRPELRGRGIAAEAVRRLVRHLVFELDYHRVQLECYGFNERAMRHVERAGFVREGVKRKAYLRHGEWVDGVMYAVIRDDLEEGTWS